MGQTKEEIEKIASDLRRDNPELVREFLDKVEETVELKKKELEAMRVIDMILQAGQSLSKKYDIIYEARFSTLF